MIAVTKIDGAYVVKINGIGINNTISISNTIKIIASKKNRVENGIRAVWLGSNPHSKGDIFSRSPLLRIDNSPVTTSKATGTKIEINVTIYIKIIY